MGKDSRVYMTVNFYSKRHRGYDKFCFRLHLFEKPLKSGPERLSFDIAESIKDLSEGRIIASYPLFVFR